MTNFESIYSYIIQTRTLSVPQQFTAKPLLKNATKIQRKTDIAKKPFNLLTMSDIFFCKCKFHYMFQHHFLIPKAASMIIDSLLALHSLAPKAISVRSTFSGANAPFSSTHFSSGIKYSWMLRLCLAKRSRAMVTKVSRFWRSTVLSNESDTLIG